MSVGPLHDTQSLLGHASPQVCALESQRSELPQSSTFQPFCVELQRYSDAPLQNASPVRQAKQVLETESQYAAVSHCLVVFHMSPVEAQVCKLKAEQRLEPGAHVMQRPRSASQRSREHETKPFHWWFVHTSTAVSVQRKMPSELQTLLDVALPLPAPPRCVLPALAVLPAFATPPTLVPPPTPEMVLPLL
jgi:hypothetical protein